MTIRPPTPEEIERMKATTSKGIWVPPKPRAHAR